MREEFKHEVYRDFSQRYANTIGWYIGENDKKLLVRVTKVGDSVMSFQDKSGFTYAANADKGNIFEFEPLERGCYNYGKDDCVVFLRKPARMWKRGICSENTDIISMTRRMRLPMDLKIIEDILLPTTKRAITRDNNVAFSKFFMRMSNIIYLYDRPIGKQEGGAIVLYDNLFQQEVTDMVRNLSLGLSVVAKNG